MPYICTVTGEVSAHGLKDAEVTVESSPKSLVQHVVVSAPSDATHHKERWVWKEENELTEEQRKRYYEAKLKAEQEEATKPQ
jgi:hypothetical protein